MWESAEGWMAKGLGVAMGLGNYLPSGMCKTKIEIPSFLIAWGFEFGSLNSSESAQPPAHSGMRICPAEAVLLCKNN